MGGIDILRRFDEMKLDWQKLHHAFLSHTHTDHSLGMVYVLRYVAFLMRLNQYDGDFHLYTHKVEYNKISKVCELILDPHETRYFDDRIIFHGICNCDIPCIHSAMPFLMLEKAFPGQLIYSFQTAITVQFANNHILE